MFRRSRSWQERGAASVGGEAVHSRVAVGSFAGQPCGGLLEAPARTAGGWTVPPLRVGGATSASTHREKIEVFP